MTKKTTWTPSMTKLEYQLENFGKKLHPSSVEKLDREYERFLKLDEEYFYRKLNNKK